MKIRVGNEMMEAEDVINAYARLPLYELEVYKAQVELYRMRLAAQYDGWGTATKLPQEDDYTKPSD